jgi:5-methylcytosine-specific restriction endonuclease McrA
MRRRTLVLNSWYFPSKIIGWQKAIKMRYEGTVEVLVEYDEQVSSPSVTWRIPAVVREVRQASRHQKGVKFSKLNVYVRDGFACQYCLVKLPMSALSYDHVVPRADGGKTTWENIVTCCKKCNAKKGRRSCDEAGMWPMRDPVRPAKLPLIPPVLEPGTAPAEWQDFLGASIAP